MIRTLKASEVAEEPYRVWNAFVELIACTDFEDLAAGQRVAHLAFWYDAEVQNGGHYQYFLNLAGVRASITVDALLELGLSGQADVLTAAMGRWRSAERVLPTTADEFIADSALAAFDDLDAAYHRCVPSVTDALSAHLAANRERFVCLETDA